LKYLGLLLLLIASSAWSEVRVGIISSTYTGNNDARNVKTSSGLQLKIGGDVGYVWGSLENPGFSIVGQTMGNIEMVGYGLGIQHKWSPVGVFLEFGRFIPGHERGHPIVQNEALSRVLVNHHGNQNRTILALPPRNFQFPHTTYRLDNGYGGRLGLSYDKGRFQGTIAYRFFAMGERMNAWINSDGSDTEPFFGSPLVDQPTGLWWQEHGTFSMSAIEVGIAIRF